MSQIICDGEQSGGPYVAPQCGSSSIIGTPLVLLSGGIRSINRASVIPLSSWRMVLGALSEQKTCSRLQILQLNVEDN